MSSFDLAIPTILRHEGGWVDDPADPGGETNFGISMLIVRREGLTPKDLGIPSFAPGSMKLMTKDTAKALYRRLFWDRYGYDQIDDQVVATKVFDCAVNCGPGRSHRMIQKAANKISDSAIVVDGILGPQTVKAINSCEPEKLVTQMAAEMRSYYLGLIEKKPVLGKFQRNWLKRARWGVEE